MSVTQCRSCDQPITFVQREDGRWRPVEVTYEELTALGNEMLAIQKAGSWQALAGDVRVYRAHACIEDPSWNRGRPRTTVATDVGMVDEATGEIDSSVESAGERQVRMAQTQAVLVEYRAKQAWRKERDAQRRAAKDSPWPPQPNGHGYDQMRDWLSQFTTVLTGEPG